MSQALDPAVREALAARIRFYRDLGVTQFYRRPVDAELLAELQTDTESRVSDIGRPPPQEARALLGDPGPGVPENSPQFDSVQENVTIPPRKPISTPPAIAEMTQPGDRVAALRLIREEIGDCTRCALHKGRNKLVFADGSPDARLMFVGEGPGADEDAQGLPFVGRAGQLLNNMIAAMGLKREEVYIANVVKCRPPGNRTPEPDEANTCSPFLFRQIDVVSPEVIVALGATAATYLLGQRQPLAGLRGRVHSFRRSKLIVTYHPAFLLRDPRQKKEAWADLQIAMRELGLELPSRGDSLKSSSENPPLAD
jgi:uracil-DNA glycosylase